MTAGTGREQNIWQLQQGQNILALAVQKKTHHAALGDEAMISFASVPVLHVPNAAASGGVWDTASMALASESRHGHSRMGACVPLPCWPAAQRAATSAASTPASLDRTAGLTQAGLSPQLKLRPCMTEDASVRICAWPQPYVTCALYGECSA